jgi:hypothetical protein
MEEATDRKRNRAENLGNRAFYCGEPEVFGAEAGESWALRFGKEDCGAHGPGLW